MCDYYCVDKTKRGGTASFDGLFFDSGMTD